MTFGTTGLGLLLASRLVRLNWLDIVVIVIYFAAVLGLGFYCNGKPHQRRLFSPDAI